MVQLLKQSGFDYFDQKTSNLIIEASLLHDIGKLSIPDTILFKPGILSKEEYSVMQTHSAVGGRLLADALLEVPNNQFLEVARQMAAHHHERWDGTGYPDRLAGKDIPLPARILAIVDVYDALTSDRVYRKAFFHTEAVKIISDSNRSDEVCHFDPEIHRVFMANHREFNELRESLQGATGSKQ